jgi:N-acetylglucosamine-6-phosphate deacetylase
VIVVIWLKNACYLSGDFDFVKGDIVLEKDKIAYVGTDKPDLLSEMKSDKPEYIDLNGRCVLPGFINIHMHGAIGYDTMTASPDDIQRIAEFLLKTGTTAFMPTTITAGEEEIRRAVARVRESAVLLLPPQ